MGKKPIRKMNREELLELLIRYDEEREALEQRVNALQAQLDAARKQLNDREIVIARAGSLAEASLQLSGVFEAAQRAADQYLENVRRMYPVKNVPADAAVHAQQHPITAFEDGVQDALHELPRRRKRGMGL